MKPSQAADLEAIKQLKARYFRWMDTQRWEEWADVFTEDARLQWGPAERDTAEGREAIVRTVRRALEGAVTCHHGHMPEIVLHDDRRASGIWAMTDLVDHPAYLLRGCGHYHEEYVKEGQTWRIRRLRLTRLREERTPKSRAEA